MVDTARQYARFRAGPGAPEMLENARQCEKMLDFVIRFTLVTNFGGFRLCLAKVDFGNHFPRKEIGSCSNSLPQAQCSTLNMGMSQRRERSQSFQTCRSYLQIAETLTDPETANVQSYPELRSGARREQFKSIAPAPTVPRK